LSQGFNSVEINATFYRFPPESWLKAWTEAPRDFSFSIKVHRSITHYTRLRVRSYDLWPRFERSLEPIEGKIDFWLFQMPADFKSSDKNLEVIRDFLHRANLHNKAVVEFRDISWWKKIEQIASMGAVFCSVDAPDLPHELIVTNGAIYLRMHGSPKWYSSVYPEKVLENKLHQIKELEANMKAIFLNNDHGMLSNGLYLMSRIYS
jgi:uncharacterized protein YecE (DUF72 family)